MSGAAGSIIAASDGDTNIVNESEYSASSIMTKTSSSVMAAVQVAASRFVGRKASGEIAAMTALEAAALLGLSSASSLLFLNSAQALTEVAVAASRFVGRKASGEIAAMTALEAAAVLGLSSASSLLFLNSAQALTELTLATNEIIARAAGEITNIAVAEQRLVGRITGGNITALTVTQIQDLVGFPRGYLAGLTLSNNVGDANHDIDVAAGECRDAANGANIRVSALTKQLDATFAAGTNAGGLDTGAIAASTLYAVWAIAKTDGTSDVLFSTSFSAPTMPSGYTLKRRIGAVLTNGSSNIIGFIQSGDYFRLKTLFTDVNDATITNETYETATLSVPPLAIAHLYANSSNSSSVSNCRVHLRPVGATDPSNNTNSAVIGAQIAGTASVVTALVQVLADSSRQIEYAAEEASGTVTVALQIAGWIDKGMLYV